MRILFVSPDIEEKARGINMILKSLMRSAHDSGHEVGLLVGYPHGNTFDKDESIKTRIQHLHIQHYLREGRKSFRYILPGGYRKRNILKALMNFSIFRLEHFKIEQDRLSADAGFLKMVDFAVQSPFFYQFLVRNIDRMPRMLLKKICRRYKIDLVVVASPSTLRSKDCGKGKIAHFVHDVMPLELIETPPDNDTPNRYGKQIYVTASQSDLILVNSNDTKSKVLEINPDANCHVLYGTASSKKEEVVGSSILESRNLTPGKYLVFASTLEKRKNLNNLMEAFSLVADEIDMQLVIIGGPGYGFEDIYEHYEALPSDVRERIIFTGYVSEADKYALLNNASAFVFPSIYEGIGLVIFEAMQSGIPVLTSNKGALPEAGGDAVLYVENPYDPEEIAEKIKTIVSDKKLREKLVGNGFKQVKKFTPEKFSQRFNKALETIK